MVHVHDLPRAKGRGGDDGAMPPINKRRLQPAKLQGSSVGSKGAGIASFFKPDPEHHARAYRPKIYGWQLGRGCGGPHSSSHPD